MHAAFGPFDFIFENARISSSVCGDQLISSRSLFTNKFQSALNGENGISSVRFVIQNIVVFLVGNDFLFVLEPLHRRLRFSLSSATNGKICVASFPRHVRLKLDHDSRRLVNLKHNRMRNTLTHFVCRLTVISALGPQMSRRNCVFGSRRENRLRRRTWIGQILISPPTVLRWWPTGRVGRTGKRNSRSWI